MPSYLVCKSLSVRYAIPVENVEGVYWLPELSPIEAAPPWFVGSVNWHGEVVHVLDLGLRFKHPARSYIHTTQLILVNVPLMRCGIVVDAVLGLIEVSESSVHARNIVSPTDFKSSYSELIEGEIKQDDQIYLLLNIKSLLTVEIGEVMYPTEFKSDTEEGGQLSATERFNLNVRTSQFSSPSVDHQHEDKLGFVLVMIGEVQYAIEVQYIAEFTHLKQFTVLPCCPDYVMGVMNLRGEILSVIDMASLLNIHNVEDKTDLVILNFESLKFALAVKKVICFQYFNKNLITVIQNIEDQKVHCKSLLKVDQSMAGVLDIEAIFNKRILEIDEHV